jgi:hypothetical protein
LRVYKKPTWREAIANALEQHGEKWEDVISCTLTQEELDVEFDDDYVVPEGKPFTARTRHRVYFPVQYDGSEWAASVARNPDGNPTHHVGG